jgi:hypothetical protein
VPILQVGAPREPVNHRGRECVVAMGARGEFMLHGIASDFSKVTMFPLQPLAATLTERRGIGERHRIPPSLYMGSRSPRAPLFL